MLKTNLLKLKINSVKLLIVQKIKEIPHVINKHEIPIILKPKLKFIK